MQSQPPEFMPPPRPQDGAPPTTPVAAPPYAPAAPPYEPQQPPVAPPFVPDPMLAGPPEGGVEPFAPPSEAWRRASPKLTTVKRISSSIWSFIVFVPAALILWFVVPPEEPVRWAGPAWLALGVAWWVWRWFRAKRLVASYGWARRDKDLCIVGGLWFRNLEVVPFGRMQVVKVSSGPLLRAYGLANVELVTAAAATNGIIPGLPADEAKALRDLIIELSDAEGSGL